MMQNFRLPRQNMFTAEEKNCTLNIMTDFNEPIDFTREIVTTLDGEPLILYGIKPYIGPVTMQYLPYGGIQSVFDGNLIITTKSGFIAPTSIGYRGQIYVPSEFTAIFTDLVNRILPD